MRDNDFTYDDVADAEIDQSYFSVVMLYQEPEDELKGKFSAKYNVAAALVDGEVSIDTFTQDKIDDETMNDTMGKVRTRVMAKSEELLTESADGLKVKITLKDGRVFEHTTAREDTLGSQKTPGVSTPSRTSSKITSHGCSRRTESPRPLRLGETYPK